MFNVSYMKIKSDKSNLMPRNKKLSLIFTIPVFILKISRRALVSDPLIFDASFYGILAFLKFYSLSVKRFILKLLN